MRLDITLADLTPSCCDNLVYAVLFDKDQRALKDNGFGVRTLQPYTTAAHADFCIPLAEHAERDRYYYVDLLDAAFALADNPKGEVYQVEYWLAPVLATFDRSVDDLRETRRVIVAGKQLVDATLAAAGVTELANVQAHTSSTYDSETATLRIAAHLDSNGALIVNPKSVTIQVIDKDGASVLNVSQTTYLTGQAGIFYTEVAGVNLGNDQTYVVRCTIIGVNDVPHLTISYLNCWD